MADLGSVTEALKYLGLPQDESGTDRLEELTLEYDVEVDTDEQGNLIAVGDLQEVLFEEHKKEVGHRPDDPIAVEAARVEREKQERAKQKQREEAKGRLREKHKNKGPA